MLVLAGIYVILILHYSTSRCKYLLVFFGEEMVNSTKKRLVKTEIDFPSLMDYYNITKLKQRRKNYEAI